MFVDGDGPDLTPRDDIRIRDTAPVILRAAKMACETRTPAFASASAEPRHWRNRENAATARPSGERALWVPAASEAASASTTSIGLYEPTSFHLPK
jgi:hypothetical protein